MDNIKSSNLYPEEEFNKLFDTCCADLAVKMIGGSCIGGLISLLAAHRRTYPLWLGMGFGLGAGYMSCQNKLRAITKQEEYRID